MKICQTNFIFQFHVLGLKLNRLQEKSASYESHKYFLSRCIRDCSIPKGLKLELEPTLRNFDQEFINSWFSKLKDFSFDTMKDIIKFCDMTIAETKLQLRSNWKLQWKEKNSLILVKRLRKTKKQRSLYFYKENLGNVTTWNTPKPDSSISNQENKELTRKPEMSYAKPLMRNSTPLQNNKRRLNIHLIAQPLKERLKTHSKEGNWHNTTKSQDYRLLLLPTLTLTLNNFMFSSKNYLQIRGCAMETSCAPSYANIFMPKFEQKHVPRSLKTK